MEQLLEVKEIRKTFAIGKRKVQAVRGVTFQIKSSESLGLIGESGCGKSTIAGMITSLIKADGGKIFLAGNNVTDAKGKKCQDIYKDVQMVFQSPIDSFNPRLTLGNSINEGLINKGITRQESKKIVIESLKLCGLSKEFANRYPHQVSGGECQRASIARAIAIKPKLIICDEATSALDVTVQSQIIKLIAKLKKEMGMSFLLISHDIALVWEICDRVLIMRHGQIIEEGLPDEIIASPQQAYTRSLIDAAWLISL